MIRLFISRRINYHFFGGSKHEMLSARIHREKWACEKHVDRIFFLHVNHCLKCHKWERRHDGEEKEGVS